MTAVWWFVAGVVVGGLGMWAGLVIGAWAT